MTHTIHKRAKVIGAPGTGKTTYLLDLITSAAKKYEPDRIGAVSLTNAAIEEMRQRVKKETGLPSKAAKNIRTIHSTCFNLLELKTTQVADKKIRDFNEAYPEWEMPLGTETTEDEHHAYARGHTPEDNRRRFREIQILRHKMIPKEEWKEKNLVNMFTAWDRWMFDNGLIDFTGMLERTYREELSPDVDILLVDEAQDISKLSLSILNMWAKETVSTVYVGDSDQAILKFAGAVPEAFIKLNHTWLKVLGKSFRVPKKIHEYAMRLIRQAKDREDVSYEPTEIEGQVITGISEPDLSLDGTHMILGRCNYHLNHWRDYLVKQGIAFHNPYRPLDKAWNPLNTKIWRAVKTYKRIQEGEEVNGVDARNMVKEMIAEENLIRGMKKRVDELITEEWVDLFGLASYGIFTEEFLSFGKKIEEVFRLKGQGGRMALRVEDMMKEPNVVIGTMHSVKGGECDHVWIDTRTSPRCVRAMNLGREAFYDEVRVGYVGVTRGRRTLGVIGRNRRVFSGI